MKNNATIVYQSGFFFAKKRQKINFWQKNSQNYHFFEKFWKKGGGGRTAKSGVGVPEAEGHQKWSGGSQTGWGTNPAPPPPTKKPASRFYDCIFIQSYLLFGLYTRKPALHTDQSP